MIYWITIRWVILMGQLNIVITRPLEEDCLREIMAVSPETQLWDASDLVAAEQRGDFTSREKLDAMLAHAEVIYGWPPQNVITRAPNLKWIQSLSAGLDYSSFADIYKSPVTVTNTRGMHGIQISELVFEMILMLAKQAPLCFRAKQERKWVRFIPMILHSKTIGIVGLGSIGREIARLARAFRMRVIATRRSTKQVTQAKNVDKLLPKDKLPELLSESDFVVLALPATPETYKLIGERELRSMKPTAHLINIARGSVVDEEALIRALDEHWIAGAGLDVFTTEPLPPESRLWELPNVVYNPHVSGLVENYILVATRIFCENLRRYLGDQKLLNIVNKKLGY
jgi:D-2-hydroxyacid dehydrogenase (NADP+)